RWRQEGLRRGDLSRSVECGARALGYRREPLRRKRDDRRRGRREVGARRLTLLMAASGEVSINQHLYKDKISYDPPRELVAVALIGIVPCVVVVASATPVRTAAELIAYARAKRGRLP